MPPVDLLPVQIRAHESEVTTQQLRIYPERSLCC
jgi:hypothetical protein